MSCDHKKFHIKSILSGNGATLVELLVAMALLLSVLLPTGMFLGYMANYPQNKNKILALGKAQTALEELLHKKNYKQKESIVESGSGWSVKEEVMPDSIRVYLRVRVYRHNKEIVSLSTVRLRDE